MRYDEQSLARDLRALFEQRGKSARSVAIAIDLPYRSMQNYLAGSSKMPASVLVSILDELGSDLVELRTGRRLLGHWILQEAITRALGDELLKVSLEGPLQSIRQIPPDRRSPDEQEKVDLANRVAAQLSVKISEAYDAFARENVGRGHLPTIDDIRRWSADRAQGEGKTE